MASVAAVATRTAATAGLVATAAAEQGAKAVRPDRARVAACSTWGRVPERQTPRRSYANQANGGAGGRGGVGGNGTPPPAATARAELRAASAGPVAVVSGARAARRSLAIGGGVVERPGGSFTSTAAVIFTANQANGGRGGDGGLAGAGLGKTVGWARRPTPAARAASPTASSASAARPESAAPAPAAA